MLCLIIALKHSFKYVFTKVNIVKGAKQHYKDGLQPFDVLHLIGPIPNSHTANKELSLLIERLHVTQKRLFV